MKDEYFWRGQMIEEMLCSSLLNNLNHIVKGSYQYMYFNVSKAFGVICKQQYFTMMTNCTDIIHINNE